MSLFYREISHLGPHALKQVMQLLYLFFFNIVLVKIIYFFIIDHEGLDSLVAASIGNIGDKNDLKRKLYGSILLTGGASRLPGLESVLEDRCLLFLPLEAYVSFSQSSIDYLIGYQPLLR